MEEKPWTTLITITCTNEALELPWSDIEDELRRIVARVGWDTRAVTAKLIQIHSALRQVRELTVDSGKTFSRRQK